MPPNKNSGTILDQFECSYKQAANPYSETKHACHEECPGTSGGRGTREREAAEPEVEDTVRVTTRARLTYELYNYSKNAMLIVTSVTSFFDRTAEISELKTTFEKFRFEVDVATIARNSVDLYQICEQFFQRDFTEYGAVALVIRTPMQVYREPPGFKNRFFEESVITDNFKLERNPTLLNKPKIYITEIHRDMSRPVNEYFNLELDRETYGDVIGIHADAIDSTMIKMDRCIRSTLNGTYVTYDGPMKIFNKKLAAMGDTVTLPEIIAETIKESNNNRLLFNPKMTGLRVGVGMVNTLNKELYFAKVEDN